MREQPFIYLDNAATTFCIEPVVQALTAYYAQPHGNPSAIHRLGFKSSEVLKEVRRFFAETFEVEAEQVIFTASGTEANNLAISGYLKHPHRKGRSVVLASPFEHSSVAKNLEAWKKEGVDVELLKVSCDGSDCSVDLDDLKKRLSKDVAMVTVMAVNNEIGAVQPIADIGRLIKEVDPNILFHVDAVQAFGKVPLKFEEWKIDLMTLSSHKIHGPVGAGALIKGKNVPLDPLMYGGGQEQGLRSGTESVGMMLGFYVAASEMVDYIKESYDQVVQLNQQFRQGLGEMSDAVHINSPKNASPYILNVSFVGYPSEVMLRMLEEEGVLTSSGSSCNMKRRRPSPVLSVIGCSDKEQQSAIRFSFSPHTTEEEVKGALAALKRVLDRLKDLKF